MKYISKLINNNQNVCKYDLEQTIRQENKHFFDSEEIKMLDSLTSYTLNKDKNI